MIENNESRKRNRPTNYINRSCVKKYILEQTKLNRPFWGCTRVCPDIFIQLEVKIRGLINIAINNHADTSAKTFNPWPDVETPIKVKNCDFINVSKIKKYTLANIAKNRPDLNINQISAVYIYELNRKVKRILDMAVESHPTIGKTFIPWGRIQN